MWSFQEFTRKESELLFPYWRDKIFQIQPVRLNAQHDRHIANRDASPDCVVYLVAVNMQYLDWSGRHHHNTKLQASNTDMNTTTFRTLFSWWWVFRISLRPGQYNIISFWNLNLLVIHSLKRIPIQVWSTLDHTIQKYVDTEEVKNTSRCNQSLAI